MMNDQSLNVKFVGEVEKRPVLYNYTLTGYSRKDITEKAWNEVGREVNMTVAECKERWKNLRAVFVRHMKRGRNAYKNKKPYYLAEAMQFTLPYIKALGSLPDVPKEEEDEYYDDFANNDESVMEQNSQSSASLQPIQPSPMPTPSPPPETPPPVITHQQGMSSYIPTGSNMGKRRRSLGNDSVENIFMEYLQAKKTKLTGCSERDRSRNPRSEGLRMFLLSMLPDLEAMTDIQVRHFKQRCLQAIDEILISPSSPAS